MFGLVGGVVSLIHFEDSAGLAFGVVCLLGAPVWFVAGRAGMPARMPPDNRRFGVTVFGVTFGMVCLVVGLGFGLGVVVEWWFLVGRRPAWWCRGGSPTCIGRAGRRMSAGRLFERVWRALSSVRVGVR